MASTAPTTITETDNAAAGAAAVPGVAVNPLAQLNPNQIIETFRSANPEVYKKVVETQGSGDIGHLASLLTQYNVPLTFPPPAPLPSSNTAGPSVLPTGNGQAGIGSDIDDDDDEDKLGNASGGPMSPPSSTPGGRRGGRNPAIGSDEWTRQRKDNHKEVERRRRGNINDGINELGRIVPSGSGEKSKGAILSRAVQYIHHLKENEARNIEKWTLEKLLMDQAMGDLQAQLEEIRRLWESERVARLDSEAENRRLKGEQPAEPSAVGQKRAGSEAGGTDAEKRQRTE